MVGSIDACYAARYEYAEAFRFGSHNAGCVGFWVIDAQIPVLRIPDHFALKKDEGP